MNSETKETPVEPYNYCLFNKRLSNCSETETANGAELKRIFNNETDRKNSSSNTDKNIVHSTAINNEDEEQLMINQQLLNIRQHFHSLSTATKSNNYLNINGIGPLQNLSTDSLINDIMEPMQQQSFSDKNNDQLCSRNQTNSALSLTNWSKNNNNNNCQEEIIYAKVQRTQNYSPKLVKFIDTIPAFINRKNEKCNRKDYSNLKIVYNVEFKLPFNIVDENNKILYNISANIEQNLLQIKAEQLSEQKEEADNLQQFPFNQIFVGSLSEKLRLMPKALLTDSIESLLNGTHQNAVILAIDGNDSYFDNFRNQQPPKAPLKIFNKFHKFLLHRGLMMHSIAWLFDAIAIANMNDPNFTPSTLNCSQTKNISHKSVFNHQNNQNYNISASIQLSCSAIFHDQIIDLISFDIDSRCCNDPKDFITVEQEREYACANAKQATHYLERSLNVYVKLKNLLFNSIGHQNLRSTKCKNSYNDDDEICHLIEHLFVFTIHIYRPQFVSSKKCKAKVNHGKLYIIDLQLPDGGSASNELMIYSILKAIFSQHSLASFSNSKIVSLFNNALLMSRNNENDLKRDLLANNNFISFTVLTNLQIPSNPEMLQLLIKRCQIVSLIKRWELVPNFISTIVDNKCQHCLGKQARRNRILSTKQYTCQICVKKLTKTTQSNKIVIAGVASSGNNLMHSDLDPSVTSSSEQSFDTVIFQDQASKATDNPQLNSNCALLNNVYNANTKDLLIKNKKNEFIQNTEHCNSCFNSKSTKLKTNKIIWQSKRNNKQTVLLKMFGQSRIQSNLADNKNKPNNHYYLNEQPLHVCKKNGNKKHFKRNLYKEQRQLKWHRNQRKPFLSNECQWSKELWVDGPKALLKNDQLDQDEQNAINNVNIKKQIIEQWIAKNTCIDNDKLNRIFDLGFKCLDDTFFDNNQYDQLESRDTLSDYGDRKSDYYDEYSTLWRKSKNKTMKVEKNNSYLDSHLSIINGCGEFIAEPPKQLKLEQFLQQLSKITISNQQKQNLNQSAPPFDYCPSMCLLARNNYFQIKHDNESLNSMNIFNNVTNNYIEELGPSHSNSMKIDDKTCDKVIDNLNNNSKSVYKYLNQSEQQQKNVQVLTDYQKENEKHQQKRQMDRIEEKLKRNTTSTATSGHGTISEGECSSIAKKTSSISTQSYVSNTGSIMVVQRQPASSGYESTIQDDEDQIVNEIEVDKNYKISEHIQKNDGLVRKKKTMLDAMMDQKIAMKGRRRKNKNCLNRIRLWNKKPTCADITIVKKSSISRFKENDSVQTTTIETGKLKLDHLIMLDNSVISVDEFNSNPDNNINDRQKIFCSFLCCGI